MSLSHAILGFLSVRPLSGYDLKRAFDASVRHFWSADQGGIYRALAALQGEGLVRQERVAQETRPDRKVYHLTEAGVAALDGWLAQPLGPVARREPLLLKLFFAPHRLPPEALRAMLQGELAGVEEELATYRGIVAGLRDARTRDEAPADLLVGPLVTLANGVALGEATRAWLQELLTHLDAGALDADRLLAALDDPERGARSTRDDARAYGARMERSAP